MENKELMKVHFGELLRKVVANSEMTTAQFAKLIGKTQQNVYDIYNREDISVQLLIKCSWALKFDFFRYLLPFKAIDNNMVRPVCYEELQDAVTAAIYKEIGRQYSQDIELNQAYDKIVLEKMKKNKEDDVRQRVSDSETSK